MRYSRILIDIAELYFRAFFTSQHIVADVEGKRMITGGIYASLKMIQRIESSYLSENGRIYFLFDNPSSGEARRKDIDPDYKINRKKQDPQFYRGLDYLQLVLRSYKDGYRIIQRPETEADDLVLPILKSFEGHNHFVLLVSNDMDWSRAIGDRVHWMVHSDDKYIIYDRDLFFNKYGFYPGHNEVCLYKALRGDASDNIAAGVKGIPEQVLLEIVRKVKSVQNMFLKLNDIQIDDQWKKAVQQNKGRILINLMLVDYQPLSMADVREYTIISEFNKSILLIYYRIFSFDIDQIDSRLKIEEDNPLREEDFFSSFDSYPRAD
jgi:5'-3' exonuclease